MLPLYGTDILDLCFMRWSIMQARFVVSIRREVAEWWPKRIFPDASSGTFNVYFFCN